MPGPVGMEKFAARSVYSFIGVSPEVISLGLQKVRRQSFASVTVIVAKGR